MNSAAPEPQKLAAAQAPSAAQASDRVSQPEGVAVRLIACLDVSGGRVVKGVNFENLVDAGDPVELAARYSALGVDEVTFLDVSATTEGRDTMVDVVARAAAKVFVPLCVGGGIRRVEDVAALLRAGADKVSVNSAAVARPELISEISRIYGAQVLTLSLDAKRSAQTPSGYEVMVAGGTKPTGLDALEWAADAQRRGVGEILLNSIDADGTQAGFDVEMTAAVANVVTVPVIASGGAGRPEHFPPAIAAGASAVLAASVFHFGPDTMVAEVKQELAGVGYPVRTPMAPQTGEGAPA